MLRSIKKILGLIKEMLGLIKEILRTKLRYLGQIQDALEDLRKLSKMLKEHRRCQEKN